LKRESVKSDEGQFFGNGEFGMRNTKYEVGAGKRIWDCLSPPGGAGKLPPLVIPAIFAEDHTLFLDFPALRKQKG